MNQYLELVLADVPLHKFVDVCHKIPGLAIVIIPEVSHITIDVYVRIWYYVKIQKLVKYKMYDRYWASRIPDRANTVSRKASYDEEDPINNWKYVLGPKKKKNLHPMRMLAGGCPR